MSEELKESIEAVEPAETIESAELTERLETVESAGELESTQVAQVAEAPRRKPKISDPAYMKTEEEIDEQIAYLKYVTKRITVVLAIALALLFLGVIAFR